MKRSFLGLADMLLGMNVNHLSAPVVVWPQRDLAAP
jgi:hypothetical protein